MSTQTNNTTKKHTAKAAKVQTHIPREANDILEHTARKHGITQESLFSDARYPDIVTARAECYARLRNELGYSYSKIAALFGRNHSGILRAIKKWEALRPAEEVNAVKPKRKLAPEKPKPKPPKTRWELARQRGSKIMARKITTQRHDARLQAIDAQIRKAEQYGQAAQARALRGERWRVKSLGEVGRSPKIDPVNRF